MATFTKTFEIGEDGQPVEVPNPSKPPTTAPVANNQVSVTHLLTEINNEKLELLNKLAFGNATNKLTLVSIIIEHAFFRL